MAGHTLTTKNWVDRVKTDEEFRRSRLVARDFELSSLDTVALVMTCRDASAGGEVRARRNRWEEEIKLMFVDVKKAHLNARCDQEEWVKLPEELSR